MKKSEICMELFLKSGKIGHYLLYKELCKKEEN